MRRARACDACVVPHLSQWLPLQVPIYHMRVQDCHPSAATACCNLEDRVFMNGLNTLDDVYHLMMLNPDGSGVLSMNPDTSVQCV